MKLGSDPRAKLPAFSAVDFSISMPSRPNLEYKLITGEGRFILFYFVFEARHIPESLQESPSRHCAATWSAAWVGCHSGPCECPLLFCRTVVRSP